MKPNFAVFLLLSCLLTGACTRNYYYQPSTAQSEHVNLMYTHGAPGLRASIDGADISTALGSVGDRNMTLQLFVRNEGEESFHFLPEQIKAYGFDEAGNRADFKVYSAEQFIRRERNRAITAVAVAAAITTVAVVASHDASGSESNNDCDTDGLWWAWAAAPSYAIASASPDIVVDRPFDGLLRRHTLYPGESVEGVVKIRAEARYLHRIVVEVPVHDEPTQFVFDQRSRRF